VRLKISKISDDRLLVLSLEGKSPKKKGPLGKKERPQRGKKPKPERKTFRNTPMGRCHNTEKKVGKEVEGDL